MGLIIILAFLFMILVAIAVFFSSGFNKKQSNNLEQSHVTYNKPFEDFQVIKYGRFINLILYLLLVMPVLLFFITKGTQNGYSEQILVIYIAVLVGAWLYLLPTFLCHTGSKYLIFIINLFFGVTVIGWFLLIIWALSSNKNAQREQEMAYLMRKISEK